MTAFPVQARYASTIDSVWHSGAVGALLALCWMLGGVTTDSTSADEVLQLASLPMLGWGLLRVVAMYPSKIHKLAIILASAVFALPFLQLLPLPQAIGMGGAARHAIAADLALAGMPDANAHASLSIFFSERALWSLLPALSLFLGALSIPAVQLRALLQLVLILALASAVFAFFQLALPDGSPLLLYTQSGRTFGGLFANSNHQGIALSISAVIAAALYMQGKHKARSEEGAAGHLHWLHGFLCLACVVILPLAKGSAAMLLVLVGLVVMSVMLGALDWTSVRRRNSGRLGLAAAILLAAIVLASAMAWQNVEDDRRTFVQTTIRIGQEFAPLGVGVGNFVPTYEQYAPRAQARMEEVNHAHNEYAQWWLEAGVPGFLVLAFSLGLFTWLGWQVLQRTPSYRLRTIAAAGWTSLLLLLMHSLVDYPLRTTALMATAGLLAGVMFNAVNASRQAIREVQDRDAATQRA